jgi:hypothetical protein
MKWGFDRSRCQSVIAQTGLPIPVKSACFFSPASKKPEIAWLRDHHPELLERAPRIDCNAQAKLTSVKGLGRSWMGEAYLAQRDDLPLFSGCCEGGPVEPWAPRRGQPPSPTDIPRRRSIR